MKKLERRHGRKNLNSIVHRLLLVIDMLLPGQDGIELVRKLRTTYTNISFIMISHVSNQPMIRTKYSLYEDISIIEE